MNIEPRVYVSKILKKRLEKENTKEIAKRFGVTYRTAKGWQIGRTLIANDHYHAVSDYLGLLSTSDIEAKVMIDELLEYMSKYALISSVMGKRGFRTNVCKHNGLHISRWRYHKLQDFYNQFFKEKRQNERN